MPNVYMTIKQSSEWTYILCDDHREQLKEILNPLFNMTTHEEHRAGKDDNCYMCENYGELIRTKLRGQ